MYRNIFPNIASRLKKELYRKKNRERFFIFTVSHTDFLNERHWNFYRNEGRAYVRLLALISSLRPCYPRQTRPYPTYPTTSKANSLRGKSLD